MGYALWAYTRHALLPDLFRRNTDISAFYPFFITLLPEVPLSAEFHVTLAPLWIITPLWRTITGLEMVSETTSSRARDGAVSATRWSDSKTGGAYFGTTTRELLMSLDKFVMRGFTGSLGSSHGRWVATNQQPTQPSSHPPRQGADTTFMFGGQGRISKGPYSKHKDSGHSEERYTFNAESTRYEGTRERDLDSKESRHSRRESARHDDVIEEKLGPAIILVAILLAALVVGATSLIIDSPSGDNSSSPSLLQRRSRMMAE